MVSHIGRFETTKFAGYLSNIYGGIKLRRGKVHDYFVMDEIFLFCVVRKYVQRLLRVLWM